jgi:hypothetical protein
MRIKEVKNLTLYVEHLPPNFKIHFMQKSPFLPLGFLFAIFILATPSVYFANMNAASFSGWAGWWPAGRKDPASFFSFPS